MLALNILHGGGGKQGVGGQEPHKWAVMAVAVAGRVPEVLGCVADGTSNSNPDELDLGFDRISGLLMYQH